MAESGETRWSFHFLGGSEIVSYNVVLIQNLKVGVV